MVTRIDYHNNILLYQGDFFRGQQCQRCCNNPPAPSSTDKNKKRENKIYCSRSNINVLLYYVSHSLNPFATRRLSDVAARRQQPTTRNSHDVWRSWEVSGVKVDDGKEHEDFSFCKNSKNLMKIN